MTFRIWSGKVAVVQSDFERCGCEIRVHEIARVQPITDCPLDFALVLRSRRVLRFSCAPPGADGSPG